MYEVKGTISLRPFTFHVLRFSRSHGMLSLIRQSIEDRFEFLTSLFQRGFIGFS